MDVAELTRFGTSFTEEEGRALSGDMEDSAVPGRLSAALPRDGWRPMPPSETTADAVIELGDRSPLKLLASFGVVPAGRAVMLLPPVVAGLLERHFALASPDCDNLLSVLETKSLKMVPFWLGAGSWGPTDSAGLPVTDSGRDLNPFD